LAKRYDPEIPKTPPPAWTLTIAILILVVEVWACAAGAEDAIAEDAIKPGKWEISTVALGLMQPPPGMQLGPGMRLGPQGVISSITKCVSATNPPFPPKSISTCKIDKSDVNGGTVSWLMTCGSSKGSGFTFNWEGIVHYHGETLDGMSTSRGTISSEYSSTVTSSSHSITGRYLGPCDTN
jgi:Protein of unknown function (DUF3617)